MVFLARVTEPHISQFNVSLESLRNVNVLLSWLIHGIDPTSSIDVGENTCGCCLSFAEIGTELLRLASLECTKHHSKQSDKHVFSILCSLDGIIDKIFFAQELGSRVEEHGESGKLHELRETKGHSNLMGGLEAFLVWNKQVVLIAIENKPVVGE